MVPWTEQGLGKFTGRIVSFRVSKFDADEQATTHLKNGNGNRNNENIEKIMTKYSGTTWDHSVT